MKDVLKKNVFRVLLLGLIAFSPLLWAEFLSYDDPVHLLENPLVQNPSFKIMFQFVNGTYIPFTILSFAIENLFFGQIPLGYHLVSVLLHLFLVYLISRFVISMGLGEKAAWLSALIFCVHPIHVESVAWISERKDVLYSVFFMLSLIFYIRYVRRESGRFKSYVFSLILACFSVLAKPMALSLPLILFLIDWWFFRLKQKGILVEKIPFILCVWPIAAITFVLSKGFIPGGVSILENFILGLWSVVFYLIKFICPHPLLLNYTFIQPIRDYLGIYLVFGLICLVLLSLIVKFRRNRVWIFAWGWWIASIFFLLGFCMKADRYMYLPSLGFCIWLAVLARKYIDRGAFKWSLGAVIILLAIKTMYQCFLWQDEIRLWNNVCKYNPSSSVARINRGFIWYNNGEYEKSVEDFSICVDSSFVIEEKMDCFYWRGRAREELGKHALALSDFSQVTISDKYPDLSSWRGYAALNSGEYKRAIREITYALNSEKVSTDFLNRGYAYWHEGLNLAAYGDFRKVVNLTSNLEEYKEATENLSKIKWGHHEK